MRDARPPTGQVGGRARYQNPDPDEISDGQGFTSDETFTMAHLDHPEGGYMRRMFVKIFVGVAFLASTSAPNAWATHGGKPIPFGAWHEARPTNQPVIDAVKATCIILAAVLVANGVGRLPSHDHYRMVSTLIVCNGVPGLSNLNGSFRVDARGGTDGPCHVSGVIDPQLRCFPPGDTTHGEDTELGWSHSSGFIPNSPLPLCGKRPALMTNKGNIFARRGSKLGTGWVKFVRVGSVVSAWGCLHWRLGKKDLAFTAQLNFTPGLLLPTKIRRARLTGTAQIGN